MTLRQEIEKLIDDYSDMKYRYLKEVIDQLRAILDRQGKAFNPQDELKAIQEWIKDNPEQHEKILDEINAQPNICPTARKMFAMMRCDHTEPTAPSQRERIATAVFLDLLSHNEIAGHSWVAQEAVTAADALIAELNKPTK